METTIGNFREWLEQELRRRDWRPAELAKAAGLYPGTIGRVLNGDRRAGPDVCLAIADALQISPEQVFRQAGLLPQKPDDPPGLDEWMHTYLSADQMEREELLEYAQFKRKQRERKRRCG